MKTPFRFNALLFFFIFSLLSSCKDRNTQKNNLTGVENDIELAKPKSVALDGSLLKEMEKAIISQEYPNIHSVLIVKNGKLVYERYFKGKDELWGDSLGVVQHGKEKLHDVRSISKSVVSACIGIAIAQGKIKSVDQKVFEFFPEYSKHDIGEKSNITLEHLLTMTTGLQWNEDVPYSDPENSEIQMTSSPDPMEYVLSRPIVTTPGTQWNYNGGTTQLLAATIKKVSGLEIDDFAKQYLFTPMGIDRFEWTNFPDTYMPAAASGLRLTSRDLLKFGLLYTQNGKWKGTRILSEDWVEKSKDSYVTFGRNNNVGYGYQFWIFQASTIAENQNHHIIAAVGNGDQKIYLDEKNNLIVVTTAGNYNDWSIKKDSEALLGDFIYPALLE